MTRHLIIWLLFSLYSFSVIAQDTSTCPTSVVLAMSRANTACADLNRNYLCYGNGTIEVTADEEIDGFAQQGDTITVQAINTITLPTDSEDYNVASMSVQANLLDIEAGRDVTMVMYGDVAVVNQIDLLPQVTLIATGLLNIRETTEADGLVMLELPLRSNLTAIGVNEEGGWYRVVVPDTDELGWVNESLVNVDGDPSQLQVVDENTILQRPFQIMTVTTGVNDAPCVGTPDSGVLMQTPNTDSDPVRLTINGADFQILGTILIHAQADDLMQVYVLNGQVDIGGELAPAGAKITVPLDNNLQASDAPSTAEPYEMTDLVAIPINNMGYRVNIAPPTATEFIQQFKLQAMTTPSPTPSREQQVLERCRHTIIEDTNSWAGPGTFYEVVRTFEPDTVIRPTIRTEVEGVTWYLLRQGGWVNANFVNATDVCGEVPLSEVVEYPSYNTLELETCESSNGPIRAGQWVTITFRDGGWETYREAQRATQVDPGRVTVDTDTLSVSASDPIQVATDRFYRVFSARWEAEAGTSRIVGQRLAYILPCDVTVPSGNTQP